MKSLLMLLSWATLASSALATSDFFQIKEIKYLAKPGKDGAGIYDVKRDAKGTIRTFVPCLEAKVITPIATQSRGVSISAVFFEDGDKTARQTCWPAMGTRSSTNNDSYDVPTIFPAGQPESIFFKVPSSLEGKKWSAVIIFGDKNEAEAKRFPDGPWKDLTFSKKDYVLAPPKQKIDRKPALDPVIEYVVHTRNPKNPQITLLLRMPDGITDPKEIQGVLAICLLANNVGDLKRQLQNSKLPDSGDMLGFADRNKLAILCWGARVVWNPGASYDEMDRKTNEDLDRSFDEVAEAWERGVGELHEKYGIPTTNYLLWGVCAAGQWAHRLALRKPDHFLAVAVHIPSSFDQPTPGASKVMWLLTAGELDGGYQRGIRFYKDCRAMGYPMIFKAVVGLGHASSPISTNLALKFLDYAWSMRGERSKWDLEQAKLASEYKKPEVGPWLASFKSPEYVGDLLNQEVFPGAKKDMIPASLRVALPNKTLADAWNK